MDSILVKHRSYDHIRAHSNSYHLAINSNQACIGSLQSHHLDDKADELEYNPLLLQNEYVKDGNIQKHTKFKIHVGDGNIQDDEKAEFEELNKNSIISKQIGSTKIMVGVTMYDEPYKNLIDSLAGIFRSYYELVSLDETYENKFSIVIISDGYSVFNNIGNDNTEVPSFAERLKQSGIYDEDFVDKYVTKKLNTNYIDDRKPKYEYIDLNFITPEGEGKVVYETHNLAHGFSKKMYFTDFLKGMSDSEQSDFQVDKYGIKDFMLGDSIDGKSKFHIYEHLPIDVHFVIKHQNRGKIESHLWYFKGFGETIKPEYGFTVDTGTIPLWNSISKMVFTMENNPQIGGAGGEIEVMINDKNIDGTPTSFLEGILLRAQYVEYKINHYLDKSTESMFGFVSVLQGAFAAYRWEAIKGRPLEKFLKGQELTDSKRLNYPSGSTANMYLTEDRIMGIELITKSHNNYILKYIHGGTAITDAPRSLSRLIKQRRRWNNGALFVSFKVVFRMCKIWTRKQSFFRNIMYSLLYIYMILQLLISYFMVGIYFTLFRILLRSLFDSDNCLSVTQISGIIENIYMLYIVFTLILGSSIRIDWAEWAFKALSGIIAIVTVFMIISLVFYFISGEQQMISILLFGSIIGVYFAAFLLHIQKIRFLDYMKGILYLAFLAPTYINIMTIYSIANIHDITWGSRIDSSASHVQSQREKMMERDYKNYRSTFLIIWVILNGTVGGVVAFMSKSHQSNYLFIIAAIFGIIVASKFAFSTIHLITTIGSDYSVKKLIKSKKGKQFEKKKLAIQNEIEQYYCRKDVQPHSDDNNCNNHHPSPKLRKLILDERQKSTPIRNYNLEEIKEAILTNKMGSNPQTDFTKCASDSPLIENGVGISMTIDNQV